MNIEIHAPQGLVKEWVINYVKDQLMELYEADREISRAEVYFRLQDSEKVCQIDLTVYGDSIVVQRRADSYEMATREVIKELNAEVDAQIKKQIQPPDEVTSTVKV